ncbi:hypothetical protein BXZ70DRAFT_998754 [Cristinia sonorae]|uniref:Uncharacterized protein n=1 Tax=Cristinia sonorae TaxID=1940300 RepID=A0A8K0UUD7_9AGAR|nr:hypothetical protein BXZ70DRAFT_998754 [Cristinia sonorae]
MEGEIPDVILVCPDYVIFYAHLSYLTSISINAFDGLLSVEDANHGDVVQGSSMPLVAFVPQDSLLFNIIIHTIYKLPCSQYNPPLDILLDAVYGLKTYGIPLHELNDFTRSLYGCIMAQIPRRPLEVYLVAAENNIEVLAVASSAHLHSLYLPDITDEMACRMGSKYLMRLIMLHIHRTESLKRLLRNPPSGHPDTLACGFIEQRRLSDAWAYATACLVGDLRPDFPVGLLRDTLGSLASQVHCGACKESLKAKVRQIVLAWSTSIKVRLQLRSA